MRLKNFINESTITDKEFEQIKKDCSYFFKENSLLGYEGRGYPLYRGFKKIRTNSFKKIKPRIDREPLDTPLELHNAIDNEFNNKFGWKVRSEGVFCSGDISIVDAYGEPYLILPIGKFKYVWSKSIKDISLKLDNIGIYNYIYRYSSTMLMKDNQYIPIIKGIVNQYQDNNFTGAVISHNEISIKCKEYYLINPQYLSAENKKEIYM